MVVLQFTKLNSAISIFTPPPTPTASKASDPTTIIILQWMGASPKSRALSSIYAKHHSLYPSARLFTVASRSEWFMTTSTATRRALLKPIVSAILSDASPKPRILVHLFSNGGSLAYVDICTLFKAQGERFEVKCVVLDSAPGQPGAKEAWEAMSIGFPRGALWYPTAALAGTAIGVAWSVKWLFKAKSMVDETYDALNDLGLMGGNAGRLYVYSMADRLVGSKDVERHMKEAKEQGVLVWGLREEMTPHVQHLLLDGERYWAKVEEFWGVVGRRDV